MCFSIADIRGKRAKLSDQVNKGLEKNTKDQRTVSDVLRPQLGVPLPVGASFAISGAR